MLFWVARMILPGVAVVLATWVAKHLGPVAGGMILSFPFVIGTGLLFALSGGGDQMMHDTAVGALRGLAPLVLFLLVVIVGGRWWPSYVCLAIGASVWLLSALFMYLVWVR